MKFEDLRKELEENDPELACGCRNAVGEVRMSNYVEDDIPENRNHHIVSTAMDDWEQPNQVVCCEVE